MPQGGGNDGRSIAGEPRFDLRIEGRIPHDMAVDADVARSGTPGSEAAGHATAFIFPGRDR